MDDKTRFNVWYLIVAVGAILLLQAYLTQQGQVARISYSEFQQLLRDGRIAEVAVSERHISGRFAQPVEGRSNFRTMRVEPDFAAELAKYDVKITGETESTLLRDILSWILPAIFFVAVWMFAIRRLGQGGLGGGFMTVGKSKAKVYMEKCTNVTFDDVAGVDEAKAELVEIVSFLREPKSYGRLGARIPKGVLLVGPPGTGKTLLACAVAGEAGVPFFSINGSEFVEMFVGVGAVRVRDLFEQARKNSPCIIFIDELDALGRARSIGFPTGGHDEKEQTLNQLLAELDGFDVREGVVLLAATNRPEILDPALLRAGRFDRQVLVDRPDKIGRVAILNVHLKKIELDAAVDPERIAALTPGFTGADLANLVNEAAVVATRRNAETVTLDDFTAAIERIVAGLEKRNRLLNEHERKVVAHHEIGHALEATALPGTDPVHKVSIIPRGVGALGYTIQRPTEDRYLMSRAELAHKMTVMTAGRAAESLIFEEISTGAADDLVRATDIARSMAPRFGMAEPLGQVAYEAETAPLLGTMPGFSFQPRRYSEETAREIDCAVRDLVQTAYERAFSVLTERRAMLERAAQALLEKETLAEAELRALLGMAPAEETANAMSGAFDRQPAKLPNA